MDIAFADFNGSDRVLASTYRSQWRDIAAGLRAMRLHLKGSDQAGIQGMPIFDAVGTNEFIRSFMAARSWRVHVPLPPEYAFLGTDVDFGKDGIAVEVQFSNYPFLLNNLMRGELLFKAKLKLTGKPTGVVVIVTKAHMFPASQSTLYYEQAVSQVSALADAEVFDVPIRVVGLFEKPAGHVAVIWTRYSAPRYSRTVVSREDRICEISPGPTAGSRSRLRFL